MRHLKREIPGSVARLEVQQVGRLAHVFESFGMRESYDTLAALALEQFRMRATTAASGHHSKDCDRLSKRSGPGLERGGPRGRSWRRARYPSEDAEI